MSLESAAAIEPETRTRMPKPATPYGAPLPLRIAQRPARDRIQRLVDLAFSLYSETEALNRDKTFTEVTQLKTLNVAEGVDFYQEVREFEMQLIKLALDHTNGCQAHAARLLNIRPTTLNSKIKLFGIEY